MYMCGRLGILQEKMVNLKCEACVFVCLFKPII